MDTVSIFRLRMRMGNFKKLFHGTRYVSEQIFTSFHMLRNVSFFERRYLDAASDDV